MGILPTRPWVLSLLLQILNLSLPAIRPYQTLGILLHIITACYFNLILPDPLSRTTRQGGILAHEFLSRVLYRGDVVRGFVWVDF